jgi:hypothetical protein
MNTKTDKIKARKITIDCAEGPNFLQGPKTTSSFEEADHLLYQIAEHGPDIGYYKTDFSITFEDGTVYEGRFDVYRWDRERPDLRKHVREFVEFYAGLRKPARLTDKQYQTIIQRSGPDGQSQHKAFLENYEV